MSYSILFKVVLDKLFKGEKLHKKQEKNRIEVNEIYWPLISFYITSRVPYFSNLSFSNKVDYLFPLKIYADKKRYQNLEIQVKLREGASRLSNKP